MPIRNSRAPKGFNRKLGHRLTEVLQTRSGGRFLASKFESAGPPQGTKPHPVYTIARDDVLDDTPFLEKADHVAWRSLVLMGDGRVDAVELRPDDLSLVGVSMGPFGEATRVALKAAMAAMKDMPKDDERELRLLRVPSLYFIGIWLHSEARDSLVPLEDHPAGLTQGQLYDPKDVQDLLRPYGERIRDMDYGLDEAN